MKAELIISLDLSTVEKALSLVDQIGVLADFYKVGPILFCQAGPTLIKELKKRNKKVFLDLKFHDIPNTVSKACLQVASMGVDLVSLHLGGGEKMIQAALKGAHEGNPKLKLIGVSVLTSMGAEDLPRVGILGSLDEQVFRLTALGLESGIAGIVCSARESAALREKFGNHFVVVTPGIRLPADSKDDQNRTADLKEALQAGSNYLVIGRPIYQAEHPREKVKMLLDMIKRVHV